MGKGEIARYEQFLLFPQCFQKACFPGASKGVIVWEWVNPLSRTPKEVKTIHFRITHVERIPKQQPKSIFVHNNLIVAKTGMDLSSKGHFTRLKKDKFLDFKQFCLFQQYLEMVPTMDILNLEMLG